MQFKIKLFFRSLLNNPLIFNIATVLVITYGLKILGFFKESYVASEFGLSELIDTYILAMIIPLLIQSVFLRSFSNVFVPNYVKALRQGDNIRSFQTSCIVLTLIVSILLLVFSVISYSYFLDVFFPGQNESYYNLILSQFYILVACIPFWGASSLLNGILNINDEFKYSTISGIFIPIVTIANIFFFKEYFNEVILAVSTLIGSVLGFLFVLIISSKKKLLHIGRPNFKDSNFIEMLRQVPYKMFSSLFTSLIPSVDNFFAAKLIIGSVAAISYGQKIPAFVLGFSMAGLGTVLLPHFSKLVDIDIRKAYNELFKMLKYLFLGAIVVVGILILYSSEIVELLFERNEFDSKDTYVVANIQRILLAYVPFYICGNIMVKFLTSINKNKFMAKMSAINFVANIFLDYFLFKYYGVYGIVLATAIIYSINPVVYYIYTRKQYKLLADL